MHAATEAQIRASFINCSKGEAKRLLVPKGLAENPWADLDFLGWSDPGSPDRNYVVAERDGELVGIVLRGASGGEAAVRSKRPGLCAWCLTPHGAGGVRLMTAPKAGPAGRQGNSVGTLICTDLACSLYVRGIKKPSVGQRFTEHLTVEEQIERTRANVFAFLDNVSR